MFDTREIRINKSRIYTWWSVRCTDPASSRGNNTEKAQKGVGMCAEYSRGMKVSVTGRRFSIDAHGQRSRVHARLAHPRSRATPTVSFAFTRVLLLLLSSRAGRKCGAFATPFPVQLSSRETRHERMARADVYVHSWPVVEVTRERRGLAETRYRAVIGIIAMLECSAVNFNYPSLSG